MTTFNNLAEAEAYAKEEAQAKAEGRKPDFKSIDVSEKLVTLEPQPVFDEPGVVNENQVLIEEPVDTVIQPQPTFDDPPLDPNRTVFDDPALNENEALKEDEDEPRFSPGIENILGNLNQPEPNLEPNFEPEPKPTFDA